MLHDLLRQFLAAERRKRCDSHQRALQPTDICANPAGKKLKNFVPQYNLHAARLFPQDRHARLDVRRLKLRGQPPFKARNQAVLQIRNLGSGPVAGKDNLFMSIEKRIESVKEFFLGPLFAPEKLDVVNQEEISLPITLPEFDQITVLDRVDELVDEQLTGDVEHLHVFPFRPDELADGLHEMGLAETDAAVNEEGIIRTRRRLRDSETRCMRDFVVRPDNERFKCVPRIQSGNRRGRSWVHSRRGHHLVGCGYILRRLRASWRRAAELYRTRITKRSNDRILQCGHVITLDPELVNVVWNSKRDRFLLCLH